MPDSLESHLIVAGLDGGADSNFQIGTRSFNSSISQ